MTAFTNAGDALLLAAADGTVVAMGSAPIVQSVAATCSRVCGVVLEPGVPVLLGRGLHLPSLGAASRKRLGNEGASVVLRTRRGVRFEPPLLLPAEDERAREARLAELQARWAAPGWRASGWQGPRAHHRRLVVLRGFGGGGSAGLLPLAQACTIVVAREPRFPHGNGPYLNVFLEGRAAYRLVQASLPAVLEACGLDMAELWPEPGAHGARALALAVAEAGGLSVVEMPAGPEMAMSRVVAVAPPRGCRGRDESRRVTATLGGALAMGASKMTTRAGPGGAASFSFQPPLVFGGPTRLFSSLAALRLEVEAAEGGGTWPGVRLGTRDVEQLLASIHGGVTLVRGFTAGAGSALARHMQRREGAAARIQAAFRGWLYRRHVAWNPNTPVGRALLELATRRDLALMAAALRP